MKKYFYIIATLFLSFSTTIAQESEKKYKYTIGGILNFQTSNYNNPNVTNLTADEFEVRSSKNSAFNSTVYAGIKLSNKRQVGIIGLFERSNSRALSYRFGSPQLISEWITVNYGIGIFYRHHFKLNSTFGLYVQPTSIISKSKSAPNSDLFDNDNTHVRFINLDVNLNLGTQYSLHPRWNLLINIWSLKYQNKKEEVGITTRREHVLDFSFNIRDIRLGGEFLF